MSMCCLRCESLHNLDDKQIGRSIQIDGIYLVIHTEHAHHMLADNMSHMPRPQQCLARRRLYAKISCRFLEAQQNKKKHHATKSHGRKASAACIRSRARTTGSRLRYCFQCSRSGHVEAS